MSDQVVSGLAKKVIRGGLGSCGPLLDRLEELNDHRRDQLSEMLGFLLSEAGAVEKNYDGDKKRWRDRGEERAFRRDGYCREAWERFSIPFSRLFWEELLETGVNEELARVEKLLDCPRQASRSTWPGSEDEEKTSEPYPYSGDGMSMGMGQPNVTNSRPLRPRRSR